MKPFFFLPFLLAAFLACGVSAQVLESRTYGVQFARGQSSITLSDQIRGSETVIYRLSAKSGQRMSLSLTGQGSSPYFVVYGPGQMPGGRSMASSDRTGSMIPSRNRFDAVLSANGDYRIEVRLPTQAASRGEWSSFRLAVSVEDVAVRPPAGNAPGTGAGLTSPYVRVTGLRAGDNLNVRGGPSTGFTVRFTLRSGEIVRNLGCTPEVGGTVWCRVHRVSDSRTQGWASARYLEASAAPGGGATQLPGAVPPAGGGVTQLPGDAQVPGTGYNATGMLACTISGRPGDCRFGVVRRGNGSATVDITLPNGTRRQIEFQAGRPVSSNSPAGLSAEWLGRDVMVTIGTSERYAVPDSVLWGG